MFSADSSRLWTPSAETHERLLADGLPMHTVVSAPMGGGKSAANAAIMEWSRPYDQHFYGKRRQFSVSWASRMARPGELEGREYHFNVPPAEFENAVREGGLLEHVQHAGGWYGTPMPIPGTPMHYEIEVTGVQKALANNHPRAEEFRRNLVAVYLVQSTMKQLLDQILARPDGMDEGKKISRAARYPGELLYIIANSLPYTCIENVPGKQEETVESVLRVIARNQSVPILSSVAVLERADEACDYLRDNDIEPTLHIS